MIYITFAKELCVMLYVKAKYLLPGHENYDKEDFKEPGHDLYILEANKATQHEI
jgi:hypothetical protein